MPYDRNRQELSIPRRKFLEIATSASAIGFAPQMLVATDNQPARRALRVVHMTDVHVQPELRAPEGMTACLRHIQQMAVKPDLILSGGDHVMDCIRQPRDRTQVQWELWKRIAADENAIPIQACVGNHDIWGQTLGDTHTTVRHGSCRLRLRLRYDGAEIGEGPAGRFRLHMRRAGSEEFCSGFYQPRSSEPTRYA